MSLEGLPPIQQLILRRAIERGGEIRLAELSAEAQKLVRYRASAALHQNSVLLERKGIIERRHEGRAVVVRVRPEWIQPLRDYFGLEAKRCYAGLLAEDNDVENIRKALSLLTEGKPDKVLLIASAEARIRLEGAFRDLSPEWLVVDPEDYTGCFKLMDNKIQELVQIYSIVCDLTGGSKVMSLALSEVARKYSLKRLLVSKNGQLIWL